MKVKDLLENDWDNNEVPTSGVDLTQHYSAKVLGVRHQLQILQHQRAALINKSTNTKHKPQIDVLTRKIDNMEASLKKEFKISVGENKIQNPISTCSHSLYVGPPEKYPDLTTSQKDIYQKAQQILKDAGLAPFSILYGGRVGSHNGINFLVVNDDRTIGWKKVDTSPGSGQNYFYIDGAGKINTQSFLYNPAQYIRVKLNPNYVDSKMKKDLAWNLDK